MNATHATLVPMTYEAGSTPFPIGTSVVILEPAVKGEFPGRLAPAAEPTAAMTYYEYEVRVLTPQEIP